MRLTSTGRNESGGLYAAVRRVPEPWALAASTAALFAIFRLDHVTGSTPFQHLYYLPIIFAGIRFGARGGAAAAVVATMLYHLANPALLTYRYEQSDAIVIALFVAAGLMAARLAGDAERLRALAMTDDLTGLHNLRSFEAELARIVRAAGESGAPFAMMVLDVDRLKAINDRHGHLAGAEAVRLVGHVLAARLPPDAIACRYGGDEFVVAMPGCTMARANAIADTVRRAVHATVPELAGIRFPAGTLSISAGVACRSGDAADGVLDESGEALFRAADMALYRAKAEGRNHVVIA